MNMNAFETGSGFSVNWIHGFILAICGTLVTLSVLVITISITMQLRDSKHKFVYDIILKIFSLVFIVALIFGVIGSM